MKEKLLIYFPYRGDARGFLYKNFAILINIRYKCKRIDSNLPTLLLFSILIIGKLLPIIINTFDIVDFLVNGMSPDTLTRAAVGLPLADRCRHWPTHFRWHSSKSSH